MSDIVDQVNQTHREVGTGRIPAGEGRTVLLRRHYAADVEDVWDACTDPDRISRWFLPITGDLRLGGRYQLQGNAGGEILRCEPPSLLAVTWVFGDAPTEEDVTEVEVRLAPAPEGGTLFELVHTAVVDEQRWAQYGPGAVGVGWDLTVIGLHLHLSGQVIEDPAAWESSPEARELAVTSSLAWGAALQASGATAEEAAIAAENTTAFYAPEPDTAP
ncbi:MULTISPECIES: SRPBCC family protein [Actinoalloteichus]|uniref:Activator of Hsp90 ATPase homologue 1/2-like C-terminal domain-containing protein n=1 Tax=Actinoalloteichus fjordicus TaxID=1612552 RepID=A0AAC9LE26_9PSEU|nr:MULTISPECIES: SRPBCC family protein [Actinoalloteichus]APU15656.1 hypothetical protein UA74_18140 [Actinoalloteichus fjordicus]APU21716.1 hypothetical protein UA75_18630 [Actinoalloteichus sp. GBA129-24]